MFIERIPNRNSPPRILLRETFRREGKTCPLAHLGHSRDGTKGKLQIVYGLLCNRHGTPVAVEIFDGNTIVPSLVGAPGWQQDTEPTPQQAKIIQLLKNHTMP